MAGESHGPKDCPKCGAKYILKSQTQPMREKETLNCSACGEAVFTYNAARSYWLEDVNKPKCKHANVKKVRFGTRPPELQCTDCGELIPKPPKT